MNRFSQLQTMFADAVKQFEGGKLDLAESKCRQMLAVDPKALPALHLLGNVYLQRGEFEQAVRQFEALVAIDRKLPEGQANLAMACERLGDLPRAAKAWRAAITLRGDVADFHNGLGNTLMAAGRLGEAESSFERAIRLNPAFVEFRVNLAAVQVRQRRFDHAVTNAQAALAQAAGHPRALAVLASALHSLGRHQEALECSEAAMRANPAFPPGHVNLATALEGLGQLERALACHEEAIRLAPGYPEAWAGKGRVLARLNRYGEAEAAYEQALALRPDLPEALVGLGSLLRRQGLLERAALCFAKALDLRPDYAEAACNLGGVFHSQQRLKDAAEAYGRALAAAPAMVDAMVGLGCVHLEAGRAGEAVALLSKAYQQDPMANYALDILVLARLQICNWDGAEQERQALLARIREDQVAVNPFVAILVGASSQEQQLAARQWTKTITPVDAPLFHHAPDAQAGASRLKIGYLSSDFNEHPVAHLAVGVFERHDRQRFETYGYSIGYDDGSPVRGRIVAAFEHFADVADLGPSEIARRIHADGIHILVDLNGYTNLGRPGILACRPAPVQVNFLGYPGTMGAPFMDYIIGDPTTLPSSEQPYFDERIVHLPDCYQPNDTKRTIAERVPSRSECGLPESGFVFCCFNNPNKLTRDVFAVWMRLLQAVPGSVLWLLDPNATVKDNLLAEIAAHGVAVERIVFASRLPLAEHLARHRVADLFLDTLPYNAHTTASDALWAGLPVLTCLGETFAGRVAASLLTAAGLPELIARTGEEYEALALTLAQDRARLDAYKAVLKDRHDDSPLFDTAFFTKHIESAYLQMWANWQAGTAPEPFTVQA